jgi:hypothetical protein
METIERLGTVLDVTAGRDAVHIAVLPIIAGETLLPGQRVAVEDGLAWNVNLAGPKFKQLGVVDPYLNAPVHKGDRFYLFLMPKSITSLRHVWTHPDFADEEAGQPRVELVKDALRKRTAEMWIRDYAQRLGLSYEELMSAAREWLTKGRRHVFHGHDTPDICYSESDEFWRRYETVTGEDVAEDDRHSFFRCSC